MRITQSEKLLGAALGLALVHHVDHVLRVDHSGWPFLAEVTPFTFSLLVYPLFLAVFMLRAKPWARVGGTAVLFLFATLSHTFLETPMDQYQTWAYGSRFPGHEGQHNLLGWDSKVLGICAVIVTVLLSATLLGALVGFVRDARRSTAEMSRSRGAGGS